MVGFDKLVTFSLHPWFAPPPVAPPLEDEATQQLWPGTDGQMNTPQLHTSHINYSLWYLGFSCVPLCAYVFLFCASLRCLVARRTPSPPFRATCTTFYGKCSRTAAGPQWSTAAAPDRARSCPQSRFVAAESSAKKRRHHVHCCVVCCVYRDAALEAMAAAAVAAAAAAAGCGLPAWLSLCCIDGRGFVALVPMACGFVSSLVYRAHFFSGSLSLSRAHRLSWLAETKT